MLQFLQIREHYAVQGAKKKKSFCSYRTMLEQDHFHSITHPTHVLSQTGPSGKKMK